MKNDNNDKILKSSLSTLLKRFSSTDLISPLDRDFATNAGRIKLSLIDDNHILKKARINEFKLEKMISEINEKGVTAPIMVTPKGDRYEVLYPRIVYIACLKNKLDTIPVSIVNLSEVDTIVFLASRIRDSKESNIVELSLLLNCLRKKYKYTQSEIASMMKQSRSQITNIMRLNKMPEWVLRDISNDKLSFGHARALSCLKEDKLNEVIPIIYDKNLSVRETEKMIYQMDHKVDFDKNQNKLGERFHCDVKVSPKQVTLTFASEEDRKKFIRKYSK